MPDTYLVTGAGRGVGLALARQIAGDRLRLLATLRDPASAPHLEGVASRMLRLDAADVASIESLRAQAADEPIDILINNAGISASGKAIESLDHAELQHIMMVNAIAPMLIAKALLPNLRAGRRRIIINITSQLGSIANNNGGSSYGYRASKAALNMLTRSLANELRPEGFTCIAVHPGWVKTDMGGPQAPLTPEQSARDILALIERLTPSDTGSFLSHHGATLPW
jgi:NAD(P)-dependent dehydrogenase (short-subunit alcohol dehydrogenase family)